MFKRNNSCEAADDQSWLWYSAGGIFIAVGVVEVISEGLGPSALIWATLGVLNITYGLWRPLNLREAFTMPRGWLQLVLLAVVVVLFALEITR